MTLEQATARCNEIATAAGLEIHCPIEYNGRLKSTLGRVDYRFRRSSYTKLEPKKIEFSKSFMENASATEADQVVLHEMTHFIITTKTGTKHGHDEVFKALNLKLGGNGRATAEIDKSEMRPKYTVYCNECGKVVGHYFRAGKVVKHPELFLSKCCQKTLRVEQNY